MNSLVNCLKLSIAIRYVGHEQAKPSAEIYVVSLSNLSARRMCRKSALNWCCTGWAAFLSSRRKIREEEGNCVVLTTDTCSVRRMVLNTGKD